MEQTKVNGEYEVEVDRFYCRFLVQATSALVYGWRYTQLRSSDMFVALLPGILVSVNFSFFILLCQIILG